MTTDYINVVTEDNQEHTIRVCGTKHNPHFFGVDICKIMGFSDFKQALRDRVNINHKTSLKNLLEKESNGILVPYELEMLKTPNLLGSFDLKNLSYHDGRVVVLSEPGVMNLLNGSKKDKNKKIILEAINRFIYTIKYENNAGLIDIFTFISKLDLTFDITSNWFQDLWYPLSKSNPLLQEGIEKVENQPIILTSNLLDWLGYQGRNQSDKQERFCRLLDSLKIPYDKIDYNHPFAIESPCVQKEAQLIPKQLKQKKWICMDVKDLKKTILKLNTKNAEVVRDYYLNLEEAMFAYKEYTSKYMTEKSRFAEERAREAEERAREAEGRAQEEQEARQEAEREQEALQTEQEKLKQELEDTKEHALILQEMMVKEDPIEKTQIIYIATTELYAKSNNFKPGGVDSKDKLKSRLSTYNTGRLEEDLFYYSDTFEVSNYHIIEAQLKNLLGRFRNKKEKEMYRLHYKDIKYIVNYLCERDGEDVDLVNSTLTTFISNLNRYNLRPVVPPPLEAFLTSVTHLKKNGTVNNITIKSSTFEEALEKYITDLEPDVTCITKKQVFDDLEVKKNRTDKFLILQSVLARLRPNIKLLRKST
jgi:hypothetical protein